MSPALLEHGCTSFPLTWNTYTAKGNVRTCDLISSKTVSTRRLEVRNLLSGEIRHLIFLCIVCDMNTGLTFWTSISSRLRLVDLNPVGEFCRRKALERRVKRTDIKA
ncbi:hypothetical protein DICVIV_04048 [Dictyocaulus viviparus]|uniref:Uncharacterized protein n=1 Tax=Dictyocaulus viviparus TaxID=29172 RepID=A0A0D8XZA4_DICVI|nr:hypothetical protein DICVIV_04048 [Dictyocaulus viviparus]